MIFRLLIGFVFYSAIFFCFLNLIVAQAVKEPPSDPQEEDQKISIGGTSAEFGILERSAGIEVEKLSPNQAPSVGKKKRGEFAATPVPVINPTIGNGLGGVSMYALRLKQEDDVSPPSAFGAGGFATDNGSWGFAVGAKIHLSRDRFRLIVGAGTGRFNYDFFGIGNNESDNAPSIPLTQKGKGLFVEPKIQFIKNWFVGPRYQFSKTTVAIDWDKFEVNRPPQLPERDFQLKNAALGLKVEWDTRDNQFYPLKGLYFEVKSDFFSPNFGGDRSYQYLGISWSQFIGFRGKNVVAYRVSMCGSSEDTPFYDMCLLGSSKDIRGYQFGQFRDLRMLVGQVEYRREIFWRFGAVGFFGAGEVAETFGDFNSENIKPAGGLGLRFLLAKETKVNLRVDYAWGQGSTAFYIGLGEVF